MFKSFVVLFAILAMLLIFSCIFDFPKGKYYNCDLAEISPDFPVEVRNECRKLRGEVNKNGWI